MTTININKLLLEQVQDLLYRVTRWKGENHEGLTDLHDIKEAVKAVLAASATAPAWNNVPTCEGLWLTIDGRHASAAVIPKHELSLYQTTTTRWYGPIPEDKP